MEAYEKLLEKTKECFILGTTRSLINWDLETYMPPKGLQQRSEQLGLLQRLIHRTLTNPEVRQLLNDVEKDIDSLNEVQRRDVFLTRRRYDTITKLPEELYGEIEKQKAIAIATWKKAKAAKDWKIFKPELAKMVDLNRQKGEIWMDVKKTSTEYDALMDYYERGLTSDDVSRVFNELRQGLVPLVKKCAESSQDVDDKFMQTKIPIEYQRKLTADLAALIGYDIISEEAGGRIDEVEHPFTTGYYDDVRITVHYYEDNITSAIFAILHEGGHALYEQYLNQEWKYRLLGEAASYGIHESQSRFIENLIGRSPEFLKFYLPKLNEITKGAFSGIQVSDFIKAANLVRPSLIRIDADEVTYSLHIIIRFEIERDLFAGKIDVSELPSVWNQKYEEYLGLDVPDDAKGVMQDTHWAGGSFGYFPSYAIGNVYDGMFVEKLNKDLPDWLNLVGKGEIEPTIKWLKENVHQKSSLYDPRELAEKVTGMNFSAKPFLNYLEDKYSKLFGF